MHGGDAGASPYLFFRVDDVEAAIAKVREPRRGSRRHELGADAILSAIADEARISDDSPATHCAQTFCTRLIREGHDIVVVAELMGHARLDQTRRYSLPTQADRERAINSLAACGCSPPSP